MSDGGLVGNDNQKQALLGYEEKIKILQKLVSSECSNYIKAKRQLADADMTSFNLEVSIRLYNHLLDKLVKCRASKSNDAKISTPSDIHKISTSATTTTTTHQPTSKYKPNSYR